MEASACRIPTEAELDWMMPVSTAPASTPSSGLENSVRMPVKAGTSRSPATAPLMVSMPVISTAKPRRIVPVSFFFSFLQNMQKTMPISASTGVKDEGLSSWIKRLLPSMPVILSSQAVTVVPMFAPMMTEMACRRRHNAGVDEADHHDRGGRGTLDDGGHAEAQQEAAQAAAGHLTEDGLQLATGLLFQRVAHQLHPEQEQGQSANERQHIK